MTVASMISKHGRTVQIQTKQSGSTDSSGGAIESWGSVASATAFVQVRSGTDAVEGGDERIAPTATFYFEGLATITTKDRIGYDSKVWSVSSVRVPGEREAGDALAYTIAEATEVFG